MLNRVYLAKVRRGLKKSVALSPSTLTVTRKPMVSDGFGGMIEDPTGTPVVSTVTARLSHERSVVADNEPAPVGMSTNLQRYITVAHDQDIAEGDTFDALGKSWKIGPVDPLVKFGGIYGYQAPLVEAD